MLEATRLARERVANRGKEPPKFIPLTERGKEFYHTSPEELAERVEQVVQWMREGIMHKGTLKKKIKAEWNLEFRAAEKYVSLARQQVLLNLNDSRENHRAKSLTFYEGIALDEKATVGDKIRARERVDKLLGLEQPQQIHAEVSVKPNGVPVNELPLEQRRQLLDTLRTNGVLQLAAPPEEVEEDDDWDSVLKKRERT